MKDTLKRAIRALGYDVHRVDGFDERAAHGRLLAMLLRELEIDLVLDVGANEGQFARELRGEGYGGRIVSFEPLAEAFGKLKLAADEDSEWLALPFALGSENGMAEIHVPAQGTDLASFRRAEGLPTEWGADGKARVETVEVRRLDSLMTEFLAMAGKRCFLKLDTQGWDLEVLRGAEGVLDQVVAAQTELSFRRLYEGQPSWRESLDEFEKRGFVPAGFFTIWREGWAIGEADCMLVRPQK